MVERFRPGASVGAQADDLASLLRDGATTAQLMQRNPGAARDAFLALAPFSQRSPSDLRTMMLEAMVRASLDSTRRLATQAR